MFLTKCEGKTSNGSSLKFRQNITKFKKVKECKINLKKLNLSQHGVSQNNYRKEDF